MSHHTVKLKNLEEIRQCFEENGVSVAEWARDKGFSLPLVYSVLSGRSQARRGESFKIGVALGLRPMPKNTKLFEGMRSPSLGFGPIHLIEEGQKA